MAEFPAERERADPTPELSPTSPRKRRRRAPTTGAADDCFSCQERQISCSRRRPYCTQCLDQGRDCSGYKTTLTWGLGVASRGKLRGLSLPVAKSKKVTADSDVKTESNKKSAAPQLTKLGPVRTESQLVSGLPTSTCSNAGSTPSSARTTTFNFVNIDPTSSVTSPMRPPPSADWRTPASEAKIQPNRPNMKRARRHSLQPLQVSPLGSFKDLGGVPMTADVMGGFGGPEFGASIQCSPMTPMFPSYHALSPTYKDGPPGYTMIRDPCEGNYIASHDQVGWHRDSVSSSLSSDQSSRDYCEDDTFYADPVVANTLDGILSGQQSVSQVPQPVEIIKDVPRSATEENPCPASHEQSLRLVMDDCGAHASLSLAPSLPPVSIGKTQSMQFLIGYYEKVISPVIIAFDGPTNPYRSHILGLAVESETLQHAISALSASNLRIRRAQDAVTQTRYGTLDSAYGHSVRRSTIAHGVLDGGRDRISQCAPTEPSAEELYHKSASIKALNQQLADPNRRLDDSILATLLMLCLYHICDTGIGKFKTQFAGVKKILAMRGNAAGANTKATNWLTIMFTWFDAMTATVNNREGQLVGNDVEWSAFNGDKWALENLAGCDGKLFQIIAKLGRLNLLSQNKPVTDSPRGCTNPPRIQPQAVAPVGPKTQDFYSMNYNRYDGNGWSSVLSEEEAGNDNDRDPRAQFWKEWAEIRQSLLDWKLGSRSPGALESVETQGDRQDVSHISQSFRYSALLYTERLAYPNLPSAHPNFQNLVTKALFHISNVRSDVFLLWPLFITGTECVSEDGRTLIRERCLSIQKDSGFFNNISGLELLERVWRDDAAIDGLGIGVGLDGAVGPGLGAEERATVGGEGFRWRRQMEKVDGEYIVV
ncbi:MAG: hypothetical protein LQ352_005606 [Teloschistes flavicans]|nr:MAG: hypothetical protein LQ352_005606 [Teloschistes flavicans]